MMLKVLVFFIFICFNGILNANSIENKILLKIDNEIITSIDVFNETKYLAAMNKKINEMSQEDIYKISIKSLIKEKIKKIEIQKNIIDNKANIDELYLRELIKNTYSKLGYNNLEEFAKHLAKYSVNISAIKKKISIESLWNELIYKKFSNKVIIDKKKLKEKISTESNKEIRSYSISEIVFKVLDGQNVDQKLNIIDKDIEQKGFSNTALLHSISSSSASGGNLGWFTEKSLNPKIMNEIRNLEIGENTKPIIIPGGFLIVKLNDTKREKVQYDAEKRLNDLIRISTNEQLNQLSNIYFQKIKKEIKIDEL